MMALKPVALPAQGMCPSTEPAGKCQSLLLASWPSPLCIAVQPDGSSGARVLGILNTVQQSDTMLELLELDFSSKDKSCILNSL